ncbi:MAG TPA: c-type cytochrome [Reyranella sp.]|nr:c-type cytochrome [Reyranella sp.]
MARILVVIAGGALLLASPANAQTAGPTGQAMAQNCYVCHGPQGRGAPPIPTLARVPADVLKARMMEFKTDQRPSTVMARIAKGYSDAQIAAISDYLGALK